MDNIVVIGSRIDAEAVFYNKVYDAIDEMNGLLTVSQINGILQQIIIEMIVTD